MRLPSTSTVFFVSDCSVMILSIDRRAVTSSSSAKADDPVLGDLGVQRKRLAIVDPSLSPFAAYDSMDAGSIRRHENRQAESGEVMQRLIDPDQRPEPRMLHRHFKGGGAKTLGAIDRDMNREIDQGDEPEPRRDDQDQGRCNRKVHKTMGQQWQRPSALLVLADRHPGILQDKIRDDMLERKEEHPPHQQTNRNRRGHGGKRQS